MKTLRTRTSHVLTVVLMLLGVTTAATAQAAPQRLAASTTICSNSPIPAGWVVTSSYSSWGCPGTGVSYTITDTAGQTNLTICSFSPKPAGWVVTSSYSSSNCVGTGVAYTLFKITTQTSAVVCSFSPLPAGWVVSSYYPSSNCYGSGVAYSIRKA
ncbi:hypothetical protein [Kitasatospora aureofaciens]|uniref:hypothetical protein n=1 Tax=Kitasatospora aureofaciens TaxID=1894 RepID=UPI0033CA70C0